MTDGCEHTTSGDTSERRGLISPTSEVWHSDPSAMGLRQSPREKVMRTSVRRCCPAQPNIPTDRCQTGSCGDGVERHALAISPDIYTRQSKTMLRARPNTKPQGV